MLEFAVEESAVSTGGYLGPADVVQVDESERRVRLRFPDAASEDDRWARLAVPFEVGNGDSVLATGDGTGDMYVIGLLESRGSVIPTDCLNSPSGAYVEHNQRPTGETFKVFSKRNELVIEYDPQTDKARLYGPVGGMEIAAPRGNLEFTAGGKLRFQGESIEMQARHGRIEIEDTKFTGKHLDAKLNCVRIVAEKLETIAGRICQRATNLYCSVQKLIQWKSARMRTTVDSTYQLKTKSAYMKSDDDFKITGDTVHLG